MIKVLSKVVSDKIAAGEVIERPLSIVKELLENSIDAGAKSITLEIKNGGKEYIRITDDGCGIEDEFVETAFLRHATSKLNDIRDLDEISTLGFRGEALASIAAVSRVSLLTKTQDAKGGTKLNIEGSVVKSKETYGCPVGTTIVVKDLFYNMPAREKFLKSSRAEASAIIDFATKMALAYVDVKFRVLNNGQVIFTTQGKGDREKAVFTLTSKEFSKSLIGFSASSKDEGFSLKGYVSSPLESRTNRRGQISFVNGRVVSSKVIEKAIDEAYKDRLFEGRFPITYLFLEVLPLDLDVNIHPNKTQIRFHHEKKVYDFLVEAIKKALQGVLAVPNIKDMSLYKEDSKINDDKINSHDIEISKENSDEVFQLNELKKEEDTKSTEEKTFEDKGKNQDNINYNYDTNFKKKENSFGTHEMVDINNVLSSFKEETSMIKEKEKLIEEEIAELKTNDEEKNKLNLSSLNIMGQLFFTYIVLSSKDYLYLVDQHAAQERVYFEKFMKAHIEKLGNSQLMLTPSTIDVPSKDAEYFKDMAENLGTMGFEIEEFGISTFLLRGIPPFFTEKDAKEFLMDLIDSKDEIGDFHHNKTWNTIATKACKASIKANDKLSLDEIKALLISLETCENPLSCPHGRPTFLKLSKGQIESRFKRT